MKALNKERYVELLCHYMPRPIETLRDYQDMAAAIKELVELENLEPEQQEVMLLIEVVLDSSRWNPRKDLPELTASEALRSLIQTWGIKQTDLAPLIGSESHLSEMINGKKGISKKKAKLLAQYFRVSVETFL
jgi:HTH-type transcriptional regulator/antitoxin HigA